jgi:hypothetical protein
VTVIKLAQTKKSRPGRGRFERTRAPTVVSSSRLGCLFTSLLDHILDRPDGGLGLVELDVVSALLREELLAA